MPGTEDEYDYSLPESNIDEPSAQVAPRHRPWDPQAVAQRRAPSAGKPATSPAKRPLDTQDSTRSWPKKRRADSYRPPLIYRPERAPYTVAASPRSSETRHDIHSEIEFVRTKASTKLVDLAGEYAQGFDRADKEYVEFLVRDFKKSFEDALKRLGHGVESVYRG
ncbi:MAG: hypothetical protein M1820_001468 [Bogoriella megaspora]|nr:MAG: hypothetical protein M1820_001468 [Bogoriella megaspora]